MVFDKLDWCFKRSLHHSLCSGLIHNLMIKQNITYSIPLHVGFLGVDLKEVSKGGKIIESRSRTVPEDFKRISSVNTVLW